MACQLRHLLHLIGASAYHLLSGLWDAFSVEVDDYAVENLWSYISERFVVNLNYRRLVAIGKAFSILKREFFVGSRAVVFHAELPADVFVEFVGTAQGARKSAANPNNVPSFIRTLEHRVKGYDAVNMRLGNLQKLADELHFFRTYVPTFILHSPEHGKDCRLFRRITLERFIDRLHCFFRESDHLSSSPAMTFIELRIATMSVSMWFLAITGKT